MNSHASSSYLMAAIAIFVTVTAVSGAPFVSPPAKIAGHNANSSVHQEAVGAESKTTDRRALIKTLPIMAKEGDTLIECCDPPNTVNGQPENFNCQECNTMCHIGGMDARHNSHMFRTACRCHVIAPCQHISFVVNKNLYDGANQTPKNHDNHDKVPVVNKRGASSKGYQTTFMSLSILSWCCMFLSLFVYCFTDGHVHTHYIKNVRVSIVTFTYINLISEYIRQLTAIQIKSSGVESPTKSNILFNLMPGLISLSFYLYLYKYNKIQNSSTHPEMSFHANKKSTKNQILKIAIPMLAVDCVYTLNIIMDWDFTEIYILHLLKPCHGIFISYELLFRPVAPLLYNKLLKRLRRREESANDVTANQIYTITTV